VQPPLGGFHHFRCPEQVFWKLNGELVHEMGDLSLSSPRFSMLSDHSSSEMIAPAFNWSK
jgi:hypothetical protein